MRGTGAIMTEFNQSGSADEFGRRIQAIADHGDREAFAELYQHFGPRIKGFLIRGGAGAHLAEDLAQEAMLTVWRKAAYFDPSRASASTWIFTIVRNLRIDGQRREKRAAVHASAMPEDQEPVMQPDEALNLVQRQLQVQEALKVLPQDQLEVVKLSFVEGKPHAEISTVLGIPLGTVKSRMRLAMIKLKSILEVLA
jgi:RNA polymerase sigma-70 factor, ECF subfamily